MKRKAFHTFLLSVAFLLIISFATSAIVFANSYLHTQKYNSAQVSPINEKSSKRTEMKVCVQSMKYYKDITLSGSPIDSKKFEDIVHAEKISAEIMCIYNKNGVMLGYCKASELVKKEAKFFAEIPCQWNESGHISNLVDLRKYILIFDAQVVCNEDKPVLVQYDTAIKLFKAAEEIKTSYGYTLCVNKAYIPASSASSETCCSIRAHSKGASLTLSILKNGESVSERIPVYEDETSESPVISSIAKLLAEFSLIRDSESDCFYDADYQSYITTDHDMSSLIYSIWE